MAPGEFSWPYYLGQVHRRNAAWEESAAALERALAIRPDYVAVHVWLGEARLALGDPDAATRAFERATSIDPSVSAAWFGLGRAALARGDNQAAAAHLEHALSLDPRASAIRYPLAMSYRALGDRQKAEAQMRLRGHTQPAFPDPFMLDVDTLLETATSYDVRAEEALKSGDWAATIAAARAGIAVSDDNPPVQAMLRHRLGTALVQTGDVRGAYEEFERAVAEAPDFARGHYSLGIMLYSMGRTRESIDHLTAAVRSDPVYLEARVMLGKVLLDTGRAREALEQFDAAIEVVPDFPPAQEGRAAALARLR
jgi:tetratricopeptide (TPR) repeat protein